MCIFGPICSYTIYFIEKYYRRFPTLLRMCKYSP